MTTPLCTTRPPARAAGPCTTAPLALVALVLAGLALGGCRGRFWRRHRAPAMTPAQLVRFARAARGRTAYVRYCALCHRADASGYAADHANAIGNADFLQVASDSFLRAAIAEGHPGTPMSAWGRAYGGPLDDGTVEDIVTWLRTRSRRRVLDLSRVQIYGNAATGERLFATHCARCHGPRGEGSTTATSLRHPTFLRNASDGFIRYTIEHGRRGTQMTAFATLGGIALDDLVAYVRSFEAQPVVTPPPPPPVYAPPPGLEHLVQNPRGRAPHFTLREDRYVPAAEVARALEQHQRLVILDARATSDWNRGHLPGALPFPFYDIETMASRLPNDGTWILAYCACPHAASGHVVDTLRARHFTHTAVIDEGIGGWTSQGFPLETGTIVSNGGANAPAAPPVPGAH